MHFQRVVGFGAGAGAGSATDQAATSRLTARAYCAGSLLSLDGAYFGVSLESGRIGASVTGANRASARYGAALYFAFDSPIGPVYIAYGHGDGRNQAVYFYVGQP